MKKITKILGLVTFLGAALWFASCNGNPEEEPDTKTENNKGSGNGETGGSDNNKNITFVGSWKSNEYCVDRWGEWHINWGNFWEFICLNSIKIRNVLENFGESHIKRNVTRKIICFFSVVFIDL